MSKSRQLWRSKIAALGTLSMCSALTHALPPIPDQSGWSGSVNLGVGAAQSENNMVDGIASFDLGEDPISSLQDSPGSEDLILPAAQFQIAYTLADSGTQFYGGNNTAQHLGFDLNTLTESRIGIRQHFEELGTMSVALVASTLATDVWKDPYITNQSRGDTEQTSSGLFVGWENIFESAFTVNFTSVEIDLDDERSGEALGLSREEQRSLRRTGQVNRLSASYAWKINDHSRLTPSIGYLDFDLDGDAMAGDGGVVQLEYLYEMNRWSFVGTTYYQNLQSDDNNPIYNDESDTDSIGATLTALYAKPFGLEKWTANATLAYHEQDSNIDFYDTSFALFSVGMLYRFD